MPGRHGRCHRYGGGINSKGLRHLLHAGVEIRRPLAGDVVGNDEVEEGDG